MTLYPERVRLASQDDNEEIVRLCRQLHEENGLFKLNENKLQAYLRKAFNHDGGFLGVIGAPGKLEGAVFLIISTFWYADDRHLEELFLYVAPGNRRAKNALDLMAFAKWCAEQSGLPLLIGVLSNIRTKGKVRLYQQQFSEPAGSFFMYTGEPLALPHS